MVASSILGEPMKNYVRNLAVSGIVAITVSTPGIAYADSVVSAPATTMSTTVQQSSSAVSYTVEHTRGGAKITGRVANVTSPTKVTLRVSSRALTGQTGNFEWEYTDAHGNFSITVNDLNDTQTRYWQLERGGGNKAYYSYSPVIAHGKIAAGQKVSSPTTPTTPPVTPPTQPTQPPANTNGKGGTMTNRSFVTYSAAGKTSQYHIYAQGVDTTKPVGLMVHFHGDGAEEFSNQKLKLNQLSAVAKDNNMILVSIKAPNKDKVWWQGIEGNGDYARSLILNEVHAKYNIDTSRSWLVGYSGGAEFISYEMMEEHSDLFTGGGAFMFGGGGSPESFARTPSASLKKNFTPIWYTGLDDDLNNSDPGWSAIDTAREGYNFYKSTGFTKAQMVTPAGIDHFEYDEPTVVKNTLKKIYG